MKLYCQTIASILLFSLIPVLAQEPLELPLISVQASFLGNDTGDMAGHHVSIIGDIDQDGYNDFLITAPGADYDAKTDAGLVYLFYGKADSWDKNTNLSSAEAIFHGEMPANEASHDAFGIGDINNDGYPDFGISIKKTQYNQGGIRAGKVYLFFGKNERRRGLFSLETADASIIGEEEKSEAVHIKGVGDIDNDHYDDFIIGSGFNDSNGEDAGNVYIYFGKPTAEWQVNDTTTTADAGFTGEAAGDWAGHRVAAAGDVNGDGYDDFLIGANRVAFQNTNYTGKAYLVLGGPRGSFSKNKSLEFADASWYSSEFKQELGWNVAGIGDVDDDGLDDILISVQKNSTFYILLAQNLTYQSNQLITDAADVAIESHGENDDIGHDIHPLGDHNRDGIDDFIIGVSNSDVKTGGKAGAAYVFYGRSNWPTTLSIDEFDIRFHGESAGDEAGFSCSGAGDVNGDNSNDILISAWKQNGMGKAYLFLTPPPGLTLLYPNGGERLFTGTTETIRWTRLTGIDNVSLKYKSGINGAWQTIIESTPNDGSFDWKLPSSPAATVYVQVSDAADGSPSDASDHAFSISRPNDLVLRAPKGGEQLNGLSTFDITWLPGGSGSFVSLEFSSDGGATWTSIASRADNNGTFTWLVPNLSSSRCYIRLVDSNDPANQDINNIPFSIQESTTLFLEAEHMTRTEGVEIEDRPDASNGQTVAVPRSVRTGTLSAEFNFQPGTYQWGIRYLDEIDGSSLCKVYVNDLLIDKWYFNEETEMDSFYIREFGEQDFALGDEISIDLNHHKGEYGRVDALIFQPLDVVEGSITVVAPNGGERWRYNTEHEIRWEAIDMRGDVKIMVSRNAGGGFTTIARVPAADESWTWNVEKPLSHECLVRIQSLNGSVSDTSDELFSIMPDPKITVTAPDGGEAWMVGETQRISWQAQGGGAKVRIDLSRDNGNEWETLVDSTDNDGVINWNVNAPASDSCLIRITELQYNTADTSNAVFSIVPIPSIAIKSPNGGEVWQSGTTHPIEWQSQNLSGDLTIELSLNHGKSWTALSYQVTDDSPFNWTIDKPASDSCLIRIFDQAGVADTSDGVFSITPPPSLTLIKPNGGQVWTLGETRRIEWQLDHSDSPVDVYLSRDNGGAWETLQTAVDSAYYDWTVSGDVSEHCLVRVMTQDSLAQDYSDDNFSIDRVPALALVQPNGGEVWNIGQTYAISWNSVNISGAVDIHLSRDNGETWELLERRDNGSLFEWTAGGPASDSCLIKISSEADSASAISDSVFSIQVEPGLVITAPDSGALWSVGESHSIQWSSINISPLVTLEFSVDDGETWTTIADSVQNNGGYNWTVETTPSNLCLIRISDTAGSVSAISPVFQIQAAPQITLSSPEAGTVWIVGEQAVVSWGTTNLNSRIRLSLSRDNGQSWEELSVIKDANSYTWTVTEPVSETCLLAALDTTGAVTDTTDIFHIRYASGVARLGGEIPAAFSLKANYPNPFNPETRLVYTLPKTTRVTLSIYDIQGRLIDRLVDQQQPAGTYMINWNAKTSHSGALSSGIYFYRIDAEGFSETRRMMLIK